MKIGIFLSLIVFFSGAALADSAGAGDAVNKALAAQVCTDLGNSCAKYQAECSSSAYPNTCLVLIAFDLGVAKERCGKSRYMSCFADNNKYKKKWMLELNIPNMANPKRPGAIQSCANQSIYHVKSARLKKLGVSIAKAMGGMKQFQYTDEKAFYACFKEHLK